MAAKEAFSSLLHFAVTPRFEVFYALRALGERGKFGEGWRGLTEPSLPAEFRASAERVAPQPMMWALLADSLRDSKPDPTFPEMLETIASFDDGVFQRAVLSGVFRGEGIVADLIEGRQSLSDAVAAEREKSRALLTLIGLHPFRRSSAVARAFTRIVSEPTEFRADLSNTLKTFWTSVFGDDWKILEPRMKRRIEAMEKASVSQSLSEFAGAAKLPVTFDDGRESVTSPRGAPMFRYRDLRGIYVIPSAFNDSRLWGAYTDSAGLLQLYFPVFDGELLETVSSRVRRLPDRSAVQAADPAILFRALGDTTRYAMARVLARSPRTSVELARDFAVSKATISHHVQLLRQAGLLRERATDRGVALALDRQALEQLASEAAPAIFASDQPLVISRSRHEGGKRK